MKPYLGQRLHTELRELHSCDAEPPQERPAWFGTLRLEGRGLECWVRGFVFVWGLERHVVWASRIHTQLVSGAGRENRYALCKSRHSSREHLSYLRYI